MAKQPMIWRYAERVADKKEWPQALLGTMTFTEARGEDTDQDNDIYGFLGTSTSTRVSGEATDED